MRRLGLPLLILLPITLQADVSPPGVQGPVLIEADGTIRFGRRPWTRTHIALERIARLIRNERRRPVEIILPHDANPRVASQMMGTVGPLLDAIEHDEAVLDGDTLQVRNPAVVFRLTLFDNAGRLSPGTAQVALHVISLRRQASASYYRSLAAEGRRDEINHYMPTYREFSRIYTKLYTLLDQ